MAINDYLVLSYLDPSLIFVILLAKIYINFHIMLGKLCSDCELVLVYFHYKLMYIIMIIHSSFVCVLGVCGCHANKRWRTTLTILLNTVYTYWIELEERGFAFATILRVWYELRWSYGHIVHMLQSSMSPTQPHGVMYKSLCQELLFCLTLEKSCHKRWKYTLFIQILPSLTHTR